MAALCVGGEPGGRDDAGAELGEGSMWPRLPGSRRRGPFELTPQAEVDDEITFHVEERIREYVARGMDPVAARAAALERLGDLGAVRSECTQLLEEDRLADARRDWFDDL